MKSKLFKDIETGELITVEQLQVEFNMLRAAQPEEYGYTFADYINNCLTVNNGTLEII